MKSSDVNTHSKPHAQTLRPETHSVTSAGLPEPVVVTSVLLAVAGLLAGAVELTVICGVVIVVVLVARTWARIALQNIDLVRTLSSTRVFAGDLLHVELRLENRKVLPLPWLHLNFSVPDGLRIGGDPHFGAQDGTLHYGRAFFETFSLQRFERVRATRPLLAERRGCYRIGAASIESGDLFGFYASRGTTPTHHQELVVLPVPHRLPGFTLPPRARDGSQRGYDPLHEDLSRPGGVREYQHGDALNRIDWKATARQGLPLVRVYDPGTSHRVMVLLDVMTSHDGWRFLPQQLEAAVSAAASVCVQLHDAGHQVGLLTNGLPLASASPLLLPGTGMAHLDALMLSLARVQVTPPVALESLYHEYAAPRLGRNNDVTIVHITPLNHSSTHDWLDAQYARGWSACRIHVGNSDTVPGTYAQAAEQGMACYDYSQLFSFAAREQAREAAVMHA